MRYSRVMGRSYVTFQLFFFETDKRGGRYTSGWKDGHLGSFFQFFSFDRTMETKKGEEGRR